ncbi:ATP-binding protein [Nitrospirillum iridis]|uniref:histidine kinase n=1 Tax=Nitrospirillum iridis TaxID=765888 RepID=A0A7X0EFB2_9PROT|nr:two-component system NtrC family sensor kinase [Nitrospirillum iridis]
MTVNPQIETPPQRAEKGAARRLDAPSSLAALRLQMLAGVLIPLALLMAAGLESWRDIVANAGDRVEWIATTVDEQTQKVVESDRLILDRAGDLLAPAGPDSAVRDPDGLRAALAGMVAGIPQIRTLWLWDAAGQPLAASRHPPAEGWPDIAGHPAYAPLRAGQTELLIPPADGEGDGDRRAFSLARRLSQSDGSLAGVAAVSVSLGYFEDFYRRATEDGPATVVRLINRDGTILASQPMMKGGAKADPACLDTRATWRPSPPDGLRTWSLNGRAALTACRLVANAPLTVTVAMDQAELDARWRRRLGWLVLLTLPVMGVLCATTALAMRRARREHRATGALHAAEARRDHAENTLLRTQRLQALDQITGGIVHDFANLLMTVRSGAEVLRRRPHTEPQREVIDAMLEAISWGERLTHNLRTFSRRPRLHLDRVRLSDMADDIAQLLRPALRGDIQLQTILPAGLWPIRVDRAEFELALLNLAVNARDAMPRGGVLRLAAANVHIDPGSRESERTGGLMGDFIRLTVADTGTGIPPDILDRIFDPFFTTKGDGQSTGLGLAQVHGLARQAGGAAIADSLVSPDPGHPPATGTTITLYLPQAVEEEWPDDGSTDGPPLPADAAASMTGKGRQILMVEDNPAVAKVIRGMLEEMGFRVQAAVTADAAQSLLTERPDISLVLSDIILPGGRNGLELAQAVRALHPGLPILLVSGYGDRVAEAESLGFIIVPKPLDSWHLRQALHRCLSFAGGA